MDQMLIGASCMGMIVAGGMFLRYWKRTGDRLFLFFAIAFLALGLNRFALGFEGSTASFPTWFHIIRFLAYCLILVGIAEKNWPRKHPEQPS